MYPVNLVNVKCKVHGDLFVEKQVLSLVKQSENQLQARKVKIMNFRIKSTRLCTLQHVF